MKKYFFIGIFLSLLVTLPPAQKTEIIKGREFIVHEVQKGETIYGISKKYDVSQDTIFFYNTSSKNGIKADQVLKFPSKAAQHPEYIKHNVTYGESLFSIAKKYGVSIEDIEKANPEVKEKGLKAETTILIPSKKGNTTVTNTNTDPNNGNSGNKPPLTNESGQTTTRDKNVTDQKKTGPLNCDSVKTTKKNFNVALILPFKGNSFNSSKIASEFYYGFKIAVDSLAETTGKTIKLYVINSTTQNDSDKTEDMYDFDQLKQMDLIIGPLYASNIKPIALFAKENKIPILSPFTKTATLTEENPYMIKITPSDKTLATKTVSYFNTYYPDCNFILINTKGTKKDSLLHLAYYEALQESGINDTNRIHCIHSKNASASSYLRPGVKNVVIYVASRESTVKDYITKFNTAYKKNNISLVGNEDWLEFSNVEADYYTNLNLHIPVATYADYTDSTKYGSFIKKYQSTVKSDPSVYSVKGYKIGTDFMGRFLAYGNTICDCLNKIPPGENSPFKFYFRRETENDGWENTTIQILSISEYSLSIINY